MPARTVPPFLSFLLRLGLPLAPSAASQTAAADGANHLDQRGQARDDLQCDIGAFEVTPGERRWETRPVSSTAMTTFGPALAGVRREAAFTDPGVITITKSSSWAVQGPESIGAWWAITSTATRGISLTVELCYPDVESNSLLLPGLYFWRRSGGSWSQVGSAPTVTRDSHGNNCATIAGVAAFSEWTLAASEPTALRVTGLGGGQSAPAGQARLLAAGGVLAGAAWLALRRSRRAGPGMGRP